MSGFTRVDNWLFDEVMPKAAPYTYKLVSAVVRQTAGWNRESDCISISQFQRMLGTSSRTTVSEAIQDAIDNGWIEREKDGQSYCYRPIIASPETVPASPDNGLVSSPESGTPASPESGHTKDISKDKVKELANHFTAETTIFPSRDAWPDKWEAPLRALYARAGSMDATKRLITKSVQFARDGPKGKTYTISSPMSITTIAGNMSLNGSDNSVKVRTR